jgi:hypothetical protein
LVLTDGKFRLNISPPQKDRIAYQMAGSQLAGAYAYAAGCRTMRGIARPALLIKRVLLNAIFRKFRHKNFKP